MSATTHDHAGESGVPKLFTVDDGATYFAFREVAGECPASRYRRMQAAVYDAPRLTPAEAHAFLAAKGA